ncbi:MAG TPA: DNA polymerase I [Anaerolineales bacterium]|nr:DNA polymerase I [Anaerolineales bacterium]HMV95056.1 DNA polymerase I [Anaerolineales bacterium]HND91647.1 DNA polymerase I [Anaerolineales bacterium]HNE67576.1 DNA polymerase I [Anaerolineales bacterium]HNF34268.1 DNA polymerase I [Anaerolineales bacterium]
MPPTLYLIDGHALAYRMYFALTAGGGSQRWQNSKGEPTAGIYGFARELVRVLEQEKPEYLAVAFDVGKTFRDDIFPEYKGTREKMPDDLRPQIERIRQMVDMFNIPRLEMDGYEADDVLGSAARIAAKKGLGVKIITGDRDLLQLVNERTAVYLAGDDQTYITDADVIKKLGVRPTQVVDYKAIVGDTSDNIPGVKGVGEKTAIALLEKFGTLDAIYANLDQVENRWKGKFEASKDAAYMSYKLAKIEVDLKIDLNLDHAAVRPFDSSALAAFFQEMEFKTLLNKLPAISGSAPSVEIAAAPKKGKAGEQMSMFVNAPVIVSTPSKIEVTVVDTDEKLGALKNELTRAKVISFDTETTSTEEVTAELVGISLAVKEGHGYYIPVGHVSGNNLEIKKVIAALTPAMTDSKIGKVAHNAKYDYIMLARYGLVISPLTFDTMLAEFIVDPSSRNLGLKNLSEYRLGEEMTHIEELIGKGKKQISMAEVAIESVANYAAADAETTLRLMPIMQKELQRVNGTKLLDEIDMPLTPVLAEMEMTGALIDTKFFAAMSQELGQRLAEIEKEIFQLAGKTFNLNSPQQLSDVLFNHLRLEPPDKGRKTTTGFYSTSADVLEALRGKHPALDFILEHRELSKLKSTYVDALPAAMDPNTGRVHTSYSQIGAVTGRLSSNNPNLQNIPIRTETGRRVRNGFIADKGNVLLSVDYSQIELRIVAHMAQDEAMLKAFRAGEDIHATTAAAIYDIELDNVTKDMRRHAKAINFGLIYGMSAFGLTRSTDLTLAEAEDFVKAYFTKFPGVKKYLDGMRRQAAEIGYVETLLGRKRYFPALQGKINMQLKNREEREAINAPIQGTAADIMKLAMLKIPSALQAAGLKGKMLLQVHDELVLECPKKEVEKTAKVVQETMAEAYPMSIPLETEARAGASWGEMTVLK